MTMKTHIHAISIERNMSAYRHGMRTSVSVYFHRGNVVSRYETNPILAKNARISNASVIRAKRAQLALMETAQKESDAA